MSDTYRRKIIIQSNSEPEDKYNLWLYKGASKYYLKVFDCGDWREISSSGNGGGSAGQIDIRYNSTYPQQINLGRLYVNDNEVWISGPIPNIEFNDDNLHIQYGTWNSNIQLPFYIEVVNGDIKLHIKGSTYTLQQSETPTPDDQSDVVITATANPVNYGSVEIYRNGSLITNGHFDYGDQCELKASANTGNRFLYWKWNNGYNDVTQQSDTMSFHVTQSSPRNYIAYFTQSSAIDDEQRNYTITPKLYIDGVYTPNYAAYLNVSDNLYIQSNGSQTVTISVKNTDAYLMQEDGTRTYSNPTADINMDVHLTTKKYKINIEHYLDNQQCAQGIIDDHDGQTFINGLPYSRDTEYKYGTTVTITGQDSEFLSFVSFDRAGESDGDLQYLISATNDIEMYWILRETEQYTITTIPIDQNEN